MENRFTFKDFVLMALVVTVIVLVFAAMRQFDRQYQIVQFIEGQNRQIGRDLQTLQDRLATLEKNGIAMRGTNASTQPSTGPSESEVAAAAAANPDLDPFIYARLAQKQPEYQAGDWYVDNLSTRVGRLTPLVNEDVYGSMVRARVMDSLLCRDPETLKYRPLLAESFELSKDGLSLRYKLRHGVEFSDGSPMTADDVIFTFDWVMNPQVDAARARSYLTEQGVSWEKVNDYEVVFRLKKPYFEFVGITGEMLILSKAFYSHYTPAQYNEAPGLCYGSGPYRLRNPGQWTPGQRLELVRNERYWGVKPAFERIIYLEVEQEAAETTMFQNGEVDALACTPEQFDQLKNDPKTMAKGFPKAYSSMLGGYTYIGWNQKRNGQPTAFADKRVRQAMTMLVDRERMAKELWRGYATVAAGPFSSRGRQANPNVKPLPYDVDKAKQLLASAGFKDADGDGLLDGPDGKPFSFEMSYPSGAAISQKIALFLKDNFAAAGVDLRLKPTDWPTLLEDLKQSRFDACTLGWSASVESDLFQIFHSSQINDAGDNRTAYSNPELDKLIEQARGESDEDKRMLLWQQAAAIVAEDQPYTFLLERQSLRFFDKRLGNVKESRMGLNFLPTEVTPFVWYSRAGMHRYSN